VDQLCDDALTIKEIAASGNLDASVRKHFDRLGAVRVVVRQGHLVVERGGFQLPDINPSVVVPTLSFHLIRAKIFEYTSKTFDVNVLDKV
jgi:hypothetical protein